MIILFTFRIEIGVIRSLGCLQGVSVVLERFRRVSELFRVLVMRFSNVSGALGRFSRAERTPNRSGYSWNLRESPRDEAVAPSPWGYRARVGAHGRVRKREQRRRAGRRLVLLSLPTSVDCVRSTDSSIFEVKAFSDHGLFDSTAHSRIHQSVYVSCILHTRGITMPFGINDDHFSMLFSVWEEPQFIVCFAS